MDAARGTPVRPCGGAVDGPAPDTHALRDATMLAGTALDGTAFDGPVPDGIVLNPAVLDRTLPDPTVLDALDEAVLGRPLGSGATIVQFSSGFCAPCRATRRILEWVVTAHDGVAHVEVDVADRADLAGRFAVTSTPTVVLLDADGVPVLRVVGVPTLAQARSVVAAVRADRTTAPPEP